MTTADWYFDFISPFAYLQWEQRRRLDDLVTLRPVPVLLAGLLQHWGQRGPAEIAPKRRFTYRHVVWLAGRLGVPLRLPPAHPFNPLRALRLAIALDNDPDAVTAIFRAIWRDGRDLNVDSAWQDLTASLSIIDADERIGDAGVKTALRHNTDRAIGAGVFGVPTLGLDGQLFWGLDATDMVRDYLADPRLFEAPEMSRIDNLPEGVRRQ